MRVKGSGKAVSRGSGSGVMGTGVNGSRGRESGGQGGKMIGGNLIGVGNGNGSSCGTHRPEQRSRFVQ
jgi:hypothetical protein